MVDVVFCILGMWMLNVYYLKLVNVLFGKILYKLGFIFDKRCGDFKVEGCFLYESGDVWIFVVFECEVFS